MAVAAIDTLIYLLAGLSILCGLLSLNAIINAEANAQTGPPGTGPAVILPTTTEDTPPGAASDQTSEYYT